MFARLLMRMKGLSVDKAFAIVSIYPCLYDLLKGYTDCETRKDKELMLSSVMFGTSRRKIGPKISRKVYKLFSGDELL